MSLGRTARTGPVNVGPSAEAVQGAWVALADAFAGAGALGGAEADAGAVAEAAKTLLCQLVVLSLAGEESDDWTRHAERLAALSGPDGGVSLLGAQAIAPLVGVPLAREDYVAARDWAHATAAHCTSESRLRPEELLGGLHQILKDSVAAFDHEAGRFVLSAKRSGSRRRAGAFYTPAGLVDHVVDAALGPVLEERSHVAPELRRSVAPRICDPACGSGNMLFGAARTLARWLDGSSESYTPKSLAWVLANCIYGADIDDTGISLVVAVGWVLAGGDRAAAASLSRHVVPGDALLGVTPAMLDGEGVAASLSVEVPGDEARIRSAVQRSVLQAESDQMSLMDLFESASDAAPDADRADAIVAGLVAPIDESSGPVVAELLAGRVSAPDARARVEAVRTTERPVHWHLRFPEVFGAEPDARRGFDVVVGNPPFLSQLSSTTATAAARVRFLKARFGDAVEPYTNPASLFLLLGVELLCHGGRVAMVQPESFLATRDSRPVRQRISAGAQLDSIWVAGERLFDAAVFVCVISLVRGAAAEWSVTASSGGPAPRSEQLVFPASDAAESEGWSWMTAHLHGIPRVVVHDHGVLGSVAEFTADFRDQYYGLAPYAREWDSSRPDAGRLVTVGLIDLAALHWGETPTRFNKATYVRPVIDEEARRDPLIGPWLLKRCVPKVLVATQTRVLECVADDAGELVPSVPVITATPKGCGIWELAAAIGSPVASAVAATRHMGAALTADALKLSANQLAELPLPTDSALWAEAASAFRHAQVGAGAAEKAAALEAYGWLACAAYGVEAANEIMDWWLPRALP